MAGHIFLPSDHGYEQLVLPPAYEFRHGFWPQIAAAKMTEDSPGGDLPVPDHFTR